MHQPTLVFLHGFRADMQGSKASYLAELAERNGLNYLRFDLSGHGQSTGHYTDFTVSDWINDARQVITTLTQGPLVLVGSSLGGWLMLALAQHYPERIAGLVGVAAAPDFTRVLIEPALTDAMKEALDRQGYFDVPSPLGEPSRFTRRLIEDGRACSMLTQPIRYAGPVRLLHGLDDRDVPWQHAVQIQERLTSADVRLHFFKGGSHQLSSPAQLDALGQTVLDLYHGL